MNPLARLARRGQRPTRDTATVRLGGADGGPGALSTLELDREPGLVTPFSAAFPPAGTELLTVADRVDVGSDETAASRPDEGAGDRFTVDQAEWADGPQPVPAGDPPPTPTTSPWRLLARLVLVVVLGVVAFHHSVGSLLHSVATGSVLVYVLAVPVYAALAAAASNRRPGYRIAAALRLRDVLLGSLLCLVALGASTLLGPGLSGVYAVWRVDLLMLWLFLLGGTVLSFGLRQVLRTWPFWCVLLLLWPFPVRLANAGVGGAVGGAVLLTLVVLAVAAYGHRADDPPRWQVLGSAAGAALAVVLLTGIMTHPQRLFWPAAVATVVVALWWAAQTTPSTVAPVAERRVRGTAPLLVALAVLGLVLLPPTPRAAAPSAPTGITGLSLGPVVVPGFATTATSTSKEQQRYFGRTSTWQRVSLRQGDPVTGPAPDGRALVVDVISTPRPQALELYPVVTTYPMGTLSLTPDAEVDLGHGVAGQLYRAEDTRRAIAYTLLTFSWRLPVDMSITGGYSGPPAQLTQRITLIALDDHRDHAPFPQPGNATLDGIRAAFESAGSPRRVREETDLRADEQLLDDTARALVHQRLTGG